MFVVQGDIDIVPPLLWSEVEPTGFMVMDSHGVPVVPAGRLPLLTYLEQLLNKPEGTLHKFTFPSITSSTEEIPTANQPVFRDQVQQIINAFPTHTFGVPDRAIKFRGDGFDDWRVRLDNDGVTVKYQIATQVWVDG